MHVWGQGLEAKKKDEEACPVAKERINSRHLQQTSVEKNVILHSFPPQLLMSLPMAYAAWREHTAHLFS